MTRLKGQTCEIDSCKWWDLQESVARGAATDCHPFIPTVPFWELQVLWQWHQCRWGCRPVGSLAQLSPGEVELSFLLSNSVQCVAEAARCKLDQFKRSKLWRVPRLANLVAMFGQLGYTPCFFFSNVKGHCHGCFFDSIWQHWNRQLQMVGLAKVACLPSFYPHRPPLSTAGASAETPKVPMGLQTCWKSCATPPWRSWTFIVAIKFRPLRGSEFPVAHGLRCVMHLASPRRSCTASVAGTSRGCFRCCGWMRKLRCRKRWWWNCCAQPVSVCLYLSLLLTGTVRWFSSSLYFNVAFVHALASRQVAWSPKSWSIFEGIRCTPY